MGDIAIASQMIVESRIEANGRGEIRNPNIEMLYKDGGVDEQGRSQNSNSVGVAESKELEEAEWNALFN